jgi:hypothetical protein
VNIISWLKGIISPKTKFHCKHTFTDYHGVVHLRGLLKKLSVDVSSMDNDSRNVWPYNIESYCMRMKR